MELSQIVTDTVGIFFLISFIIVFTSWLLFKLKKVAVIKRSDPIMIIYREETMNPEYILRKRINERFVLINKNYRKYVN